MLGILFYYTVPFCNILFLIYKNIEMAAFTLPRIATLTLNNMHSSCNTDMHDDSRSTEVGQKKRKKMSGQTKARSRQRASDGGLIDKKRKSI